MPTSLTGIRVFLASPSGLEEERAIFRETIDEYNLREAHPAGVCFIPVQWEHTIGGVGRTQELINRDLRASDYSVLALHDRWGSPTGGRGYTSGCEEEYDIASACIADASAPMRDIGIFLKGVPPEKMADPGEQLTAVLAFRQRIESTRDVTYDQFDEAQQFAKLLRGYLAKWRREHAAHGEADGACARAPARAGRGVADPSIEHVEAREDPSPIVRRAQRHASDGALTEAEVLFSRAVVGGPTPEALVAFGEFLERQGRYRQAEAMYESIPNAARGDERWACVSVIHRARISRTLGDPGRAIAMVREARENAGARAFDAEHADALQLEGELLRLRGDLEGAERAARGALAINDRLGRPGERARQLRALGRIERTRGRLERAEELYREALSIERELARDAGVAQALGGIGAVQRRRGDLEGAERSHREALEIEMRLGRREGIATQLGSLGLILRRRGDLSGAEKMHREALAIEDELGRKEGMAQQYGNLGLVLRLRGELDEAESMHRRTLAIEEDLQPTEGIASELGNLGLVLQERGDLDGAEAMHRRSLALEEMLGRKEGMASDFANLAETKSLRGDLEAAREYWTKSLGLYTEIGDEPYARDIREKLKALDARTVDAG